MDRMILSGKWRRLIDGRQLDYVDVPGSYAPVGQCVLEREFEALSAGDGSSRYFLVTEGVAACAKFVLNGQELGTAGPWATYRFEIQPGFLRERNVLQAHVRDLLESFGPMPGRRFDGGLIRNLRIERRPRTFLSDFVFRAELNEDFSAAACSVEIEMDGPQAPPAEIVLAEQDGGRVVARARASVDAPARFDVENPRLWSPQTPNLYFLTVSSGHGEVAREQVGFRRVEARGQDLYLNGQVLLLKGVCRHEFTHRSGYCPSEAEVRRELERIKHAGFNYVRLVHSPQVPCVCRIAAEIGLLVSEEPGTCFHDLTDSRIYASALDCLCRTVRRDRNVPSILAWLIYNECNPDTAYAVKAAAACRQLDPTCRLSFADVSGRDEQIKEMVAAAGLTYYGINVYSFNLKDFNSRMETFLDRPLVITEWGGWLGVGNRRVLRAMCDNFVAHSRPGQPQRIAGCSFWAWADYEEHSRSLPAAIDGWTVEGLVDAAGRAKEDLLTLSDMCFDMDHPAVAAPAASRVEVLLPASRREQPWLAVPLDGVGGDQSGLERQVDQRRREQLAAVSPASPADSDTLPRLGRLLVDGIDFACRDCTSRVHPLMIGAGREEAVIPVGQRVSALAVIGHSALSGGYPASNIWSVHHRDAEAPVEFASPAAEYILVFDDGEQRIPLRHGLEILRANDICRWWTPQPRSPHTRPAVRAVVNLSYEILRLDLWEKQLDGPRTLREIRWRLLDKNAVLVLAALSVLPAAGRQG